MNPGTASAILKKNLLFVFAQKLQLDYCFQCGAKIETVEEFSVEHKKSWLDSPDPVGLFFDLDNIAFSHLSCNVSASRRRKGVKHPSQESYRRGCRCSECKEIERIRRADQRSRGIKT